MTDQTSPDSTDTDRLAEKVGRYSLDEIRTYLAGPPVPAGPGHGRDLDRMAWLLDRGDRIQKRLDAANSRYSDVVLKVGNLRYDDVDGRRFPHEHGHDGPECAGCWVEAIDEALGLGEEADDA